MVNLERETKHIMEVRERNQPQDSSLNSLTRNETLDHHHHTNNYNHRFLQQQQQQTPDPVSVSVSVPVSQPVPPPDNTVVVRYRECLKNHAATMGTYALDGCGEFMPNGDDGTPESLKCAACDCHRSFHRREVDGQSHNQPPPPPPRAATMQPPHYHHRYNHQMPPFMVAFGGNNTTNVVAQTESSSEDLDMFRTHSGQPSSKKRFRTKFSEEQKEKMHEFAEKIGWRIQKQDEQEILQFCNEVGLKRKVFKVWMHNSKQASKKKQE